MVSIGEALAWKAAWLENTKPNNSAPAAVLKWFAPAGLAVLVSGSVVASAKMFCPAWTAPS